MCKVETKTHRDGEKKSRRNRDDAWKTSKIMLTSSERERVGNI